MRSLSNVKYVIFAMLLPLTCCTCFSRESVPYVIDAQMEMSDESESYEIAGIDLYFFNKDEKPVKELTVVFYLFDGDGEPVFSARSNISLCIQKVVPPQEGVRMTVSLDPYLYEIPEELYSVDYLYISRIVYEDGSDWSDPYGLMVF